MINEQIPGSDTVRESFCFKFVVESVKVINHQHKESIFFYMFMINSQKSNHYCLTYFKQYSFHEKINLWVNCMHRLKQIEPY